MSLILCSVVKWGLQGATKVHTVYSGARTMTKCLQIFNRLAMAIVSASLPVMKPCILWVGRKLGMRPINRTTRSTHMQHHKQPSISAGSELQFPSLESRRDTIHNAQQILDEDSLFYRLWVAESATGLVGGGADISMELSSLEAQTQHSGVSSITGATSRSEEPERITGKNDEEIH